MIAFGFRATGSILTIVSTQFEEQGKKDALLIGSGVLGLVSFVLYIDAEKWISRRRLTFTGEKLSYRF